MQIYFCFVSNLCLLSTNSLTLLFLSSLGIHQQENIDENAEGDVLRIAENIFTFPLHGGHCPPVAIPLAKLCPTPMRMHSATQATIHLPCPLVAVLRLLSSRPLMIKYFPTPITLTLRQHQAFWM